MWVIAEIMNNKIVVTTDDINLKCLFEVKVKKQVYQNYAGYKGWRDVEIIEKIYDNKKLKQDQNGSYSFIFGRGWGSYLCNILKPYLREDQYYGIINSVRADYYRTTPFPELRPYQNEDILHLLKFKTGLMQVYTGYGKSQCICLLANFAYRELGKKVLLITPGKKAKEELVKRAKTVFDLDIPKTQEGNIDCIITSGFLNRKEVKQGGAGLDNIKNMFCNYDWVLIDEAEYCVNGESGKFILENLIGAERFYGFSGTADKYEGKMISFADGLTDTVAQNKEIIKYFGPSLVYRLPLHLEIDDIQVSTNALNNLNFTDADFADDSNVYMTVMNKIWTDQEICDVIVKIAKRFPKLFIPINNLNYIITDWIDNHFKGVFRVLLISGEGFIYYDLDGNKTKLDLQQACDYISQGLVDIIPGTSSSYRALDFPNLENILLIQGKVAGVVLQAIGRVARSKHMNIISLKPKVPTRIPVYSKGMKERDEMIREYYKYCKYTKSIINEEDL